MVFLIFFTRIHQPPPLLLLLSHNQQLYPAIPRSAFFSINHTHNLPRRIHTKSRRWDSNAETFRTQNFDFNSTDDDDDFEEDDDDTNQWLDILEDFIDAFLMALAIPIGQSALSFVFQTVWGRPKNKAKQRGKSKRRPPPPPPRRRGGNNVGIDDEQEKYTRGERKRATGYQTWVAGDGAASDEKSNGSSSSFGGWEELDRRAWSNTEGKRKTSKSKLSRRGRSETPLLMRLLIAVFPFLGSWTRFL